MTKPLIFAAMLVLPLSEGRVLADGMHRDSKLISEGAVRTASAALYSDILARACRRGWRYPRSQIESGFRRHLGELKLRLVDQGYTVLPEMVANSPRVQGASEQRQVVGPRQFGCSRPYWLDE